ncbi:MAG: hypothetical protein H6867_03490 [Rhodospirillales bacterium]|nr:hypothetical protein [Rhodospirillales bacterium]
MIFVCLADDAPDFKAALGDLPAVTESVDFTAFHYHDMATHTIGCNWKTYVENYSEGYHIPYVHPGLNKEVDFKTYRVVTGDKIAQHLSQPREHRKDDAINDGLWVWHWPYAALNVYRNGMNLELMVPTGPEQTTLYYYYLFKDLADKEANDRTMAMSREVTDEDRKICEIVQKNLRAGVYTQGELSPRHEGGVAYFQDLVREKVK